MLALTLHELIREARKELHLYTDGELASFLGVSRRTVQRHAFNGGIPVGDQAKLVRAFYPLNPAMALTLARAFNVDLSDLVAAAAPKTSPGPAPVPRPPAGPEHVASVILAACDAFNLPPREVRPALVAIFRQALALGVDLDQLAKLLAGGEGPAGKKS